MCTQRRLVGAACNGEYSFYYYTECAAGLDCRNDTCLPACK